MVLVTFMHLKSSSFVDVMSKVLVWTGAKVLSPRIFVCFFTVTFIFGACGGWFYELIGFMYFVTKGWLTMVS